MIDKAEASVQQGHDCWEVAADLDSGGFANALQPWTPKKTDSIPEVTPQK